MPSWMIVLGVDKAGALMYIVRSDALPAGSSTGLWPLAVRVDAGESARSNVWLVIVRDSWCGVEGIM